MHTHRALIIGSYLAVAVIGALATALLYELGDSDSAYAQTASGGQTRGVFAFTGQLDEDTYGLFMVDVDACTLWVYECQRSGRSSRQLKLVAARNWLYDRFLHDYNNAPPLPGEVESMVSEVDAAGRARSADRVGPDAAGSSGRNDMAPEVITPDFSQ